MMPCLRLNISGKNCQGFCLPLWLDPFLAHFKAKLVEQKPSDILLMLCVRVTGISMAIYGCACVSGWEHMDNLSSIQCYHPCG